MVSFFFTSSPFLLVVFFVLLLLKPVAMVNVLVSTVSLNTIPS